MAVRFGEESFDAESESGAPAVNIFVADGGIGWIFTFACPERCRASGGGHAQLARKIGSACGALSLTPGSSSAFRLCAFFVPATGGIV